MLYVSEVKVGGSATTDYTVDYDDGKIKFGTAPASGSDITATYYYADSNTQTMHVGTAKALDVTDISKAKRLMLQNKRNPEWLVLPALGADLLQQKIYTKFILEESTREIPVLVGRVLGLDTYVSNVMWNTMALVGHKQAGIIAVSQEPTVRTKERPEKDGVEYYVTMILGAERVDNKGIEVIIGFAENAY